LSECCHQIANVIISPCGIAGGSVAHSDQLIQIADELLPKQRNSREEAGVHDSESVVLRLHLGFELLYDLCMLESLVKNSSHVVVETIHLSKHLVNFSIELINAILEDRQALPLV